MTRIQSYTQSYTLEELQAEIQVCLQINRNRTDYDDYNDMLLMDLLAERDRRLPPDDEVDSYYGSMELPLKG